MYRTIDMRFGGKMNNGVDLIFYKNLFETLKITNINRMKKISLPTLCPEVPVDLFQVFQVSGISKFIQVYNFSRKIALLEEIAYKITADEPGATSY